MLHLLYYDVFESHTASDDDRTADTVITSDNDYTIDTVTVLAFPVSRLALCDAKKSAIARSNSAPSRMCELNTSNAPLSTDLSCTEPLISGTTSNAPLSADLLHTEPLISGTFLAKHAFYRDNFSFHEDDLSSCYFSDWQN